MIPSEEIQSVNRDLSTQEQLRHLLTERFPRQTVVTASLMAPSIVVLKMISDIDPATPVVFCQRSPFFDESIEYRAKIVEILGLQNISINEGHETDVRSGDQDHCERMWIHHRDLPGRSFQLLHLNDCLSGYSCWISAVYHLPRPNSPRNRVDVDGDLVKVDPLARWSKDDVRDFMREHKLPFHKMAKRKIAADEIVVDPTYQTGHF